MIGLGLGIYKNRLYDETSYWDGTIATSYGGGTGTQTNPYLITSGSEMAYLAQQVNSGNQYTGIYFKQTKNIDLKSLPWTPIGSNASTYTFRGVYNGDGYWFDNINVNRSAGYNGLFGAVRVAIITAAVIGGTVKGGIHSGGVVGYCYNSEMSNCFNAANISAYTTGVQYLGGVVGRIAVTSAVSNCYNIGKVTNNTSNNGGITGAIGASTLTNCYNAGELTLSGTLFGSIVGSAITSTITKCYYDNQLSVYGGINNSDVINQAEGKTTAQMKTKSTYSVWDFAEYWEYKDNSYPSLILYEKNSYYFIGLGNIAQSSDAAVNTFLGANISVGNQYKEASLGQIPRRTLTGRKFFAVAKADHYSEDDLFDKALLQKYGFSSTFYVQLPVAADNPLNIVPESVTNQTKRAFRRIFSSGNYLGNHGIQHYVWVYLFPLFDGIVTPSNDDFRVARGDGTNAFGFDVNSTLNDAYTTTITSSAYLNISFGATAFKDLSDAQCLELRQKVSFFTASDYRYKQDMLKAYDYLSNRYCGTSGYSVVDGDYTTRTPNTTGGVYPSDENKIQGGIFQGASTLCNHEVWERLETIYDRWTAEQVGRNHPLKYWAVPGGVTNGFLYAQEGDSTQSRKYHDRGCTKIANGFSKYLSSITNISRGYMNVLKTNGYKSTMGGYIGYAWSGYDGNTRKESSFIYKLNSSSHKQDYVGDGFNDAIRVLDYELAADAGAWATFLASTNMMLDKYDTTKADVTSIAIAPQNNFAQVIEEISRRIAWGLIPESVEDSGVGVTNTLQRRACLAITYELIYQFCKENNIEVISHEEASELAFSEITKGVNIFPNYELSTTVKDFITDKGGSLLCSDAPDGWSGGIMQLEGDERTLTTSELIWIRNYIIQNGSATMLLSAKGKGSVDVYRIRNKHTYWETYAYGACQYELIGSIEINSVDYESGSLVFEIPLEPLKTYTTETEDWQNYFQGLDDRICGLHIEVVPDAGESITIKSPSLIVV